MRICKQDLIILLKKMHTIVGEKYARYFARYFIYFKTILPRKGFLRIDFVFCGMCRSGRTVDIEYLVQGWQTFYIRVLFFFFTKNILPDHDVPATNKIKNQIITN